MAHRFIKEIAPGETINDIYMVKDPILRSTTRGDLYIAMYLCDKTGQANGRMWQASEVIYQSLPQPGFMHIKGRSEVYQNNMQIVINQISVIDASKVDSSDFLAHTEKDVDAMFAEVTSIVANIENKQLKAIVDEFLSDEELMEKFRTAPGGMQVHHNYLGGLLEHTHGMLGVAKAILPLYPQAQADVVLAGIFIHDMGKTEELSYDMAFSYTDTGQLLGHISKTYLMLNRKVDALRAKGTQIDETVVDALGHIILSHHGEYEFGSPKIPATLEAFMVCYIDNLDAKMNQVGKAIDDETSESNWTGWQRTLETRLYRKRIE